MNSPTDWEHEVHDSPAGWVAEHVERYVRTDGGSGHAWKGVFTLLLTTLGRQSGMLRRTALIYGRDGDRYVIVASKGGSHKHPAWYLNLRDHPEVFVQIEGQKFVARAITAAGEERERLWELMAEIWPEYERYQQRTSRQIPVVTLERVPVDSAGSPS